MAGMPSSGPRQQCPDAVLNVSASTSASMLPSTAKAGLDVRTDVVAAGRSSLGGRYSSSSPVGGGPGTGNPQISKAKNPLSVPPQQLHAPTPPGGPMSVPAKIEHPSSSDYPSPLAFNDPRTPRNSDSPAKPASLAASHHRSSTPAYASTSSMLCDQLHAQQPAGGPSTQSHVGTSSNGKP